MLGCFQQFFIRTLIRPTLAAANYRSFSQFDERDKLQLEQYDLQKNTYQPYLRMKNLWEKPLAKKRLRQQRIRQIKQTKTKTQQQPVKLIVHNAAAGIEYPVPSSEFFCIAEVDGFQYKLMEDCRITLDNKPDLQLNQRVRWDKVLLVASKDFTLLGRPFVNGASIDATVEEKLRASKIIVFKKKRRKQYKRSHGFRAKLTVLRINKINYSLTDKELTRAVNLQ